MIIVRVSGGLGNQMFQYAFGRRLSLDRGVPLMLDVTPYRLDNAREYKLDVFKIEAEIAEPGKLPFLRPGGGVRQRLVDYVQKVLPPPRLWAAQEQHTFQLDPDILKVGRSVYLKGYWQTPRYFEPIADRIREDFTLRAEPDAKNRAMAQAIAGVNAVSLHIRRGDYVTVPKYAQRFGVLPLDYYVRAVERIAETVDAPHFFVFSDDPLWARENLKLDHPMTVVDYNGARDDEDLRLMTACRHHIIANSTFSWWGAWLGHNPARQVIAPAKWFQGSDQPTPELIPESWQRV